MSAAKRYSEAEVQKLVVDSFRTGMRVGEIRARRVPQETEDDQEAKIGRGAGIAPRSREHLTIIQGGAA